MTTKITGGITAAPPSSTSQRQGAANHPPGHGSSSSRTAPDGLKPLPRHPAKPGDIIMEDSGAHTVLWSGEAQPGQGKPVTHSAAAPAYKVISQGAESYARKHAKSMPTEMPVFRVQESRAQLGELAAQTAKKWATVGMHAHAATTPFGKDRLTDKEADEVDWTRDAAFRAARAYLRADEGMPLSKNQGVTCSQFGTYTYQAAAIEDGLKSGTLGADAQAAIQKMREDGAHRPGALGPAPQTEGRAEGRAEARSQARHGYISEAASAQIADVMPQAVRADAKIMSSEALQDRLKAPDSGFQRAGYAAPLATGVDVLPKSDPHRKEEVRRYEAHRRNEMQRD